MYFVLCPLPHADGRAPLTTGGVVIIGIGNDFRRDDGVGPAVAQGVAERRLPGVRVVGGVSDPAALLDIWDGAVLAVVVDANSEPNAVAGRIRRWAGTDLKPSGVVSSHLLGLPQTFALGQALDRLPGELVVFTVDITDAGHGVGLTPAVAAAVPDLVELIVAELAR